MRPSKTDIAISLSAVGITIFLTFATFNGLLLAHRVDSYDCAQYGKMPQFWSGQDASDGWYEVGSIIWKNATHVSFPNCPSYGGQLHGTWKTNVAFSDDFSLWYDVKLEENVIVEANQK